MFTFLCKDADEYFLKTFFEPTADSGSGSQKSVLVQFYFQFFFFIFCAPKGHSFQVISIDVLIKYYNSKEYSKLTQ